ncbi:MAG: molybdate ABC transporter permease subunit [Peptoniphilaceae bacterium]
MSFSPIYISIKTAIISTIITFFLGIYAARFVSKKKKTRWIFDAVFTLPMVLPPTVVGFILLIVLGNKGPFSRIFEQFDFNIIFSYQATIIAAVIVSFPLMYRTALGAFLQIDSVYIEAGQTLGLKNSKIFWKIILPLSKESLFSGIVLSFARALGEFGATIMIAGNIAGKTQTISTAIYSAVQAGNKSLALKWSIIVIGISLIAIILLNISTKNRWGKWA